MLSGTEAMEHAAHSHDEQGHQGGHDAHAGHDARAALDEHAGHDKHAGPRIIALSRATYRKMIQNLWWAAGYNIVAIPLAAGVLERWGVVLSPAIGAVLMSASTIIVAVNAQLLRRAAI